jgi:O-acetyl-ADP-ribose deacetylase (regulator of RNase III)
MHSDSYMVANLKMLCEEYSELDHTIVQDVYAQCQKDCDRARTQLNELCGRKKSRGDDEVVVIGGGGFSMEEIVGDLFGCSSEAALAHCVSECLAMGKGIAVEFKKRFGCVSELKSQRATIGTCAVLHPANKRWVYYLITKARYFNKPTLADLRKSIVWMRDHALKNGVTHIAMPRLGCGLDGLKWEDVKAVLREVFDGTNIRISVYRL